MTGKLSPVGGSPYQAGHPASLACSTGVIFLAERKARDKRRNTSHARRDLHIITLACEV